MLFRNTFGLMLVAAFAFAGRGYAEGGEDHKAKWEEMKKKHEECLKTSGAFDDKTLGAMKDCHETMMKDHEKPAKGHHPDMEAMKAKMDACLKEKGITLTDAQHDAIKNCHGPHKEK